MAYLRVRERLDGSAAREAFDLSTGIDPLEMGRIALAGVRADKANIYASMDAKPMMKERFDAVMRDFDGMQERLA
jgi:hypothetical protein